MNGSAPDTIVLIHGFWVTPRSWEDWIARYEAKGYRVIDHAYATEAPTGTFRAVTDESLKLTKDEAVELAGELDELIQRWGARTRARGREGARDGGDARRTYQLFQVIQPYPEEPGSPVG